MGETEIELDQFRSRATCGTSTMAPAIMECGGGTEVGSLFRHAGLTEVPSRLLHIFPELGPFRLGWPPCTPDVSVAACPTALFPFFRFCRFIAAVRISASTCLGLNWYGHANVLVARVAATYNKLISSTVVRTSLFNISGLPAAALISLCQCSRLSIPLQFPINDGTTGKSSSTCT